MHIVDHRFPDLWHALSPNNSGPLANPRFLVMHYTAGWSGAGARDYLMNPHAPFRPSAHLVIDRSGEAWQIVPFDTKAHHAGRSYYRGVRGLNHHSIGIELDNIGWLRPEQGGMRAIDPYGSVCAVDPIDGELWLRMRRVGDERVGRPYCRLDEVYSGAHPKGGPRLWWPLYPEPQLATLERLTTAILAAYPSIRETIGHDDCTPRKTDPGPAFPMKRYQALLNDRRSDGDDWRVVTASALNVRGGPGLGFERLQYGPLRYGTLVKVLHEDGNWVYGRFSAPSAVTNGWLYSFYLEPTEPPEWAGGEAAAAALSAA